MVPLELLFFSWTLLGAVGIQITNLKVPKVVKNNSGSAVVLDCDYYLTPEERNTDSYGGLVVKWFLDNFDSPVYQWIPGKKPQDLGALKRRVNISHRASDNPATMYRALYIPNPTTDLSGDYKCLVSTFNDEDFMVKRMVVFATEKSLEIEQTKLASDSVNLTCRARGVYPEPKMALYKNPDSKASKANMMEGVTVRTSAHHRSYDIIAWKVVDDTDLESPTVFACELTIPEADYSVRKNILYYPGMFPPSNDSGKHLGSHVHRLATMLLALIAFLLACC